MIGERLCGYSGIVYLEEYKNEVFKNVFDLFKKEKVKKFKIGPVYEAEMNNNKEAIKFSNYKHKIEEIPGGCPYLNTHLPSFNLKEWSSKLPKRAWTDILRCEKRLNEAGKVEFCKIT